MRFEKVVEINFVNHCCLYTGLNIFVSFQVDIFQFSFPTLGISIHAKPPPRGLLFWLVSGQYFKGVFKTNQNNPPQISPLTYLYPLFMYPYLPLSITYLQMSQLKYSIDLSDCSNIYIYLFQSNQFWSRCRNHMKISTSVNAYCCMPWCTIVKKIEHLHMKHLISPKFVLN